MPGHDGFDAAAHVFNPRFDDIRPAAVAFPLDARDVQAAIRFTTAHGIQVRARSGGHSYAGYSTLADGAVLDLRRLNTIRVDGASRTATIGAGCQLIDVASTLAGKGSRVPVGSCPSVGIAGVSLGGGFGLASRQLGLTIDSMVSVQIVTADGQLWTVDESTDHDLMWALRGGGGGNFGVVTEFVFTLHPAPRTATYFDVEWPWPSAAEAVAAWQAWAPHAREEVTSILHVNAGSRPSITANGQYAGPARDIPQILRSLLDVPGAELRSNLEMGYLSLQLLLAGCADIGLSACHTVGTSRGGRLPRETFNAKSDYVARPLTINGLSAMIAAAEAPGVGAMLCDSYGGAIARVAADATAFAHREQLFCVQYYGTGAGSAWIDQAAAKMHPFVSGQAYQNYIDPTLKHWQQAYYAGNLARLQATRKRVDPEHYFNFPQAIGR